MAKEQVPMFICQRERFKEIDMRLWNGSQCFNMGVYQTGARRRNDTVGCQRCIAAQTRVQPIAFGHKVWIMLRRALHKQLEHVVMIALDEGPIPFVIFALNQQINDATAVWSAIHKITDKKQVSIVATIGIDQRQRAVKLRHLSVDITEGIEHGWPFEGLCPRLRLPQDI
jgi:hypothetical protein